MEGEECTATTIRRVSGIARTLAIPTKLDYRVLVTRRSPKKTDATRTSGENFIESCMKRTEECYANRVQDRPVGLDNKQVFVPRYKAGEFGNASPTWNSYSELVQTQDWRGLGSFHIRNRIAQGATWYDVPHYQMDLTWKIASSQVGAQNLYVSAMAPHWANVIQGEVWQDTTHLHLTYSDLLDLPMRDALRQGLKFISDISAVMLLKRSLCPNSWEWLNQLLDNYQDHIVEFSTFEIEWGTVPHYNTVFWECRNY